MTLQKDLANGLADAGREKRELQGQIDHHLRATESLQSEIRAVKANFEQARYENSVHLLRYISAVSYLGLEYDLKFAVSSNVCWLHTF